MSDKGTIEQLHAELVQAREELAQAQTECNVLAKTFTDANELHAIVRRELAQARRRLAIPDQICGYCGYRYSAGTNEVNFAVMAEHIKSCPKHPLAKALVELAQARAELKDLQVANRECGRQLAQRTNSRDYWVGKCQAAEIERDQIRKEAEGLRRQLKHAEGERDYWVKAHDELEMKLDNAATGEAAIVEAAKALLKLSPIGVTRLTLSRARRNLLEALEHRSDAAAKLLERLAEAESIIRTHEHALGKRDEALQAKQQQYARLYKEVQDREAELAAVDGAAINKLRLRLQDTEIALQAERQLRQEAELVAHVHSKTCDELAQTARTERAERQEAEASERAIMRRLGDERQLRYVAEQRAEALAGTLAEVHAMLNCSPEHPWHGCTAQTVCNEAHYHNHVRGARELLEKVLEGETPTNTQALAALVTPELAGLLEKVGILVGSEGWTSIGHFTSQDGGRCLELAACIRAALELEATK